MTSTVRAEVERRSDSAADIARQLEATQGRRLADLAPSHVDGRQLVRQAMSCLRDPKLAQAAGQNFASFVEAVERASVLGLRPGSEEFYLTPRFGRSPAVVGIVGYQGLIELMYRSGAVESVIAELVYERDAFSYVPGRDVVPVHEIDWDVEDRGGLRLVYAYARMSGGGASKVVVMPRGAIARVRAASDSASSSYSPWQKHEPAMWLKSGIRQLAKWVPTSVERLRQVATAEAMAARDAAPTLPPAPASPPALGMVDTTTGMVIGDVDIEEPPGWDDTAEATGGAA